MSPTHSSRAIARAFVDRPGVDMNHRPKRVLQIVMECASHGGRGPVEKAGYPPHRTCRGDNPIPAGAISRPSRTPARTGSALRTGAPILRRGEDHTAGPPGTVSGTDRPRCPSEARSARCYRSQLVWPECTERTPMASSSAASARKNRMHWREPASGAERSSVLPHGGSTRARTFRTHPGASCLQTATR
jgi:hypothetical protein